MAFVRLGGAPSHLKVCVCVQATTEQIASESRHAPPTTSAGKLAVGLRLWRALRLQDSVRGERTASWLRQAGRRGPSLCLRRAEAPKKSALWMPRVRSSCVIPLPGMRNARRSDWRSRSWRGRSTGLPNSQPRQSTEMGGAHGCATQSACDRGRLMGLCYGPPAPRGATRGAIPCRMGRRRCRHAFAPCAAASYRCRRHVLTETVALSPSALGQGHDTSVFACSLGEALLLVYTHCYVTQSTHKCLATEPLEHHGGIRPGAHSR